MAHKPGHSGFSYWNGEEDKKPKKKRKRRRKVDVAKAVVKSDKESKEQKSKAKTVQMMAKAELDAADKRTAAAKKELNKAKKRKKAADRHVQGEAVKAVFSGPFYRRSKMRAARTVQTKRRKEVADADYKLRDAGATPEIAGTTMKQAKKLAESTVEGESQKQARMKKVVKAAKTQASMKAYAKKKKRKK